MAVNSWGCREHGLSAGRVAEQGLERGSISTTPATGDIPHDHGVGAVVEQFAVLLSLAQIARMAALRLYIP